MFVRVPFVFRACSARVPHVFHSCSARVPLVFRSCSARVSLVFFNTEGQRDRGHRRSFLGRSCSSEPATEILAHLRLDRSHFDRFDGVDRSRPVVTRTFDRSMGRRNRSIGRRNRSRRNAAGSRSGVGSSAGGFPKKISSSVASVPLSLCVEKPRAEHVRNTCGKRTEHAATRALSRVPATYSAATRADSSAYWPPRSCRRCTSARRPTGSRRAACSSPRRACSHSPACSSAPSWPG